MLVALMSIVQEDKKQTAVINSQVVGAYDRPWLAERRNRIVLLVAVCIVMSAVSAIMVHFLL